MNSHNYTVAGMAHKSSCTLNLETDEEMVCTGYLLNKTKKICVTFFTFLSLGILQLVFHWKKDWRIYCTCSMCPLQKAEILLIKNKFGEFFIENIKIVRLSTSVDTLLRKPSLEADTEAGPGGDAQSTISEDEIDVDESQVLIHSENSSENSCKLVYFEHRKVKYVWNKEKQAFHPLTSYDVATSLSTFYTKLKGLAEDEQKNKQLIYGVNDIYVEVKSYKQLFIEEILNPFYMFQVFSCGLWFVEHYIFYAVCIIVISAVSLTISLYETHKQAVTLRDMVAHTSKVKILKSNGSVCEVDSQELVPGDLLIIPSNGCMMSCDAVLVSGNCIVNESMLTGESVPVTKTPLPNPPDSNKDVDYSPEIHKRHTLFCGTKLIQTRHYGNEKVKAVVLRTGFSSTKGQLIRSILFPKPIGFKFYKDALKFIGALFAISAIGIVYTIFVLIKDGAHVFDIIVKALDIITIAVPPALPAAMTVGTVYAQNRLKAAKIFCISPQRINVCGKLKLFCFDKTGTLTEDGLDMLGVVPVLDDHFLPLLEHVDELSHGPFLSCMATCHSLTIIDGIISGDPLDLKMFEATKWLLQEQGKDKVDNMMPTIVKPTTADTYINSDSQTPYEIGIVRQFPFSSSLQRMSVITRTLGAPNMDVYMKGAPEMVVSMCNKTTVPSKFHEELHAYTEKGLRVIGLAWRPLDLKLSWHHAHKISRSEVENDLQFLGLLILQNMLKPETTPIIHLLREADIRTVMVTGDNVLTATSVARDCGMIEPNSRIIHVCASPPSENVQACIEWTESDATTAEGYTQNSKADSIQLKTFTEDIPCSTYNFAVTGKSFAVIKNHFQDLMPKIVQRGTVFARMSPDQKVQLVEELQALGYSVGMCGDGANDCGALKAAHAGISLSEAEASVASPFTSQIANISCVPKLIREGRASLVTSFGVFKYMALYSLIQYISVTILYWINSNLSDKQFLYADLAITTTVAILMSYNGPYQGLVKKRPPGSLLSPVILISIIIQIFIQATCQATAYGLLFTQSWFTPLQPSEDVNDNLKCAENSAVFLTSCYQYFFVAAAFSKGPPYRTPLHSNMFFLLSLVAMFCFTTFMLFWRKEIVLLSSFFLLEQLAPEHFTFCLMLFMLIIVNAIATFSVECIIGKESFKTFIRSLRRKTKSKNIYKLIEKEIREDKNWPPIKKVTNTCNNGETANA
ncbi:polyamine-transporting ATPase 13A3-like [Antedon mediterranea]|uniref:polyamine-transporting ATPase 13A3-like n=1 Tax=Antedon mediterranea TaxID=105859 RepID=UPI003AF9F212